MLGPGKTLGRYRIESPLGAGGMGEVFRAWDGSLRRWVALKVVARDATGRAERLLAEARAVATLKHPNVVAVFDVGEVDGVVYVSMDLIVGQTLRGFLGDAATPVEKRKEWLVQIASALASAHHRGLVHRDVKPENVMVGEDGEAHVLDFGIAKPFGVDVVGPTQHSDESAPASLRTAEGRVIGTPAYMAPEQLAGGPPAPAWDQYSWGLVAYELLTGKHPRLDKLIEANGWVKSPEEVAGVPHELAEIVARAAAPTAEQRFSSMDDLVLALGGAISVRAPGKIQSLPPPGSGSRSRSRSSPPPRVDVAGVGSNATLPAGAPAPPPRVVPFWAKAVAGIAAVALVLGVGIAVGRGWSGGDRDAGPAPSASVSATSTASWSAPPPASIPVVASSVPPVASSAPPVASSVRVATPPPPRRPLVVYLHLGGSPSYDRDSAERVVRSGVGALKSCLEQHRPAKLPTSISVTLELWPGGPETGDVRDVIVRGQTPMLEKCFHEVLGPMGFGPSQDPHFPPTAVFFDLQVEEK